MNIPRIVIGGVHSGVGKTSLTLALVAALTRRGLRVRTFKVGPDFLDPTYLSIASGRPCYNLDGWMSNRDYVQELFVRAASAADIAVIEGVMGLFDSIGPSTSEGSTAEIAGWLKAPILLVADVHGMARSLAALVKGYVDFDPHIVIAGVLANGCGLESHTALLADALMVSALPPLVGGIPKGALPELPSRHLGLVSAEPGHLSRAILDQFADAAERYVSLDEVMKLAQAAPSLDGYFAERETVSQRLRLGVAHDSAFHFYYQDLFDELARQGCEVVFFSPLMDAQLPEGLDALYIGGGYPEEHAESLSQNQSMLAQVRQFVSSGRPVYAECGGLMYLSRALESLEGKFYPLAGIIPVETTMRNRRFALSYAEVTLKGDSLWGKEGTVFRGHEFHYSELLSDPAEDDGWQANYAVRRRHTEPHLKEGFQSGNVLASYIHLHLGSRPGAVKYFVDYCCRLCKRI